MREDRKAGTPHLTKQVAAAAIGASLRTLAYMRARDEVTRRFVKGRTRPVVVNGAGRNKLVTDRVIESRAALGGAGASRTRPLPRGATLSPD